MKKQMWMRIISGTLAGVMMMTTFAGCDSKKKEEEDKVSASSVVYNDEGKYTTTITSDKIKLSGVTADNVSVIYKTFDFDGYDKAMEEADDDEEVEREKYYIENKATVNEVKENDGALTVSFTDDKAAENITDFYSIHISKPEAAVGLDVEMPEYTFTSNIDAVSAHAEQTRLTLMLNDSEFAQTVTADNITLYGAFSDMKIESLSSAGKNLTMQLSGKPVKDESSGVYLNGYVEIDREAIANAAAPSVASIPVATQPISFDIASLAVNGEAVTVVMNVYDADLFAGLSAEKVSFEKDVTVTKFEKTGEDKATLTLKVNGVTDKNSAAAVMNGQAVTIGESAITADFAAASFYPVFDYVEKNGENLNFTLMLYSVLGSFAGKLTPDMVSLGDDFSGGKVLSVERTSDLVAKLMISVPANGQSEEALNMNGSLTLKGSALVNEWGDASAQDVSNTRDYTNESMGKAPDGDTVTAINNFLSRFGNVTVDQLKSIGSAVPGAASGFISVLEILGVVESEKAKLDKIYNQICQMSEQLCEINAKLEVAEGKDLGREVSDFYKELGTLESSVRMARGAISDAKNNIDAKEPAPLEYDKNGKCTSSSALQAEWKTYMKLVMAKVRETDSDIFTGLLRDYQSLCAALPRSSTTPGIVDVYDEYMTYCHNFDTAAYSDRENFRTAIRGELLFSTTLLAMYYEYGYANPQNAKHDEIKNMLNDAYEHLDSRPVKKRTDKRVYCYVLGREFKQQMEYSCHSGDKKNRHCAIFNDDGIKRYGDDSVASYKGNGSDFNDNQQKEFIRRMQVRNKTIRQELDDAGFKYSDGKNLSTKVSGVAFYSWKDTSSFDGEPYDWSSRYIPFDYNPQSITYEKLCARKYTYFYKAKNRQKRRTEITTNEDMIAESYKSSKGGGVSANVRFVLNWVFA